MKGRRAALASALAVVAIATVLPARAQTVPRMLVAVASAPVTPAPETSTSVVAVCGSGTPLVGGGMLATKADPADPRLPINALRGKASYPSDVAGAPVADGSAGPAAWSATANFATNTEADDQIISLALCTTRKLDQRVVVIRSLNGPVPSDSLAPVTVTCPPGTVVLGGGAQATPVASPTLKPVGMYPSDAAGNMLPDGAPNPTSWTAVGASGGRGGFSNTTTAYAVCGTAEGLVTRVARVDAPGPQAASASTTTTVGCGADSLIGGGVLVDRSVGTLQIGVHLRGSYPSNVSGAPAVAGTADPAAWSAVVSSGGQPSPNTMSHVFSICVVEPPAV
jgi:hypothetical protein